MRARLSIDGVGSVGLRKGSAVRRDGTRQSAVVLESMRMPLVRLQEGTSIANSGVRAATRLHLLRLLLSKSRQSIQRRVARAHSVIRCLSEGNREEDEEERLKEADPPKVG
jgi:hypothetical protein